MNLINKQHLKSLNQSLHPFLCALLRFRISYSLKRVNHKLPLVYISLPNNTLNKFPFIFSFGNIPKELYPIKLRGVGNVEDRNYA